MDDRKTRPLRLGVSRCLLGEAIRYDGASKPHPFVVEVLARDPAVELLPVCPETEIGMPTPREPVDLVGDPAAPRMLGVTSRRDWTATLNAWAEARIDELLAGGLDGFILKSRSPSCGHGSTPIYRELGDDPDGAPRADGLFALALRNRLPDLPVAEETDLDDPVRREAFLAAARRHRDGGG